MSVRDRNQARYNNGVLTVHMPKRGQQMPGRRSAVETGETGGSPASARGATTDDPS